MNPTVGLRVEALLAELDEIPNPTVDEYQTRRSEIFQEVLQLVAISLDQQKGDSAHTDAGRWV